MSDVIQIELGSTAREARARGLQLPSSIPNDAKLVGQGEGRRSAMELAHRRHRLRMAEDGTWWAWRPKK